MNLDISDICLETPDSVLGNDLVFLPGFKNSFNTLFADKVYTEREKAYCYQFRNSILRFASTWAAKEACYKALKQAFPDNRFWFRKIEIIRNGVGQRPSLVLSGNPVKASLSISHDGEYVWSTCLIDKLDFYRAPS